MKPAPPCSCQQLCRSGFHDAKLHIFDFVAVCDLAKNVAGADLARRQKSERLKPFLCVQPLVLGKMIMRCGANYNSRSMLNCSCQGSPLLATCSRNGSGSNSSTLCTPGLHHKPLRNIMAPVMAGTPVV